MAVTLQGTMTKRALVRGGVKLFRFQWDTDAGALPDWVTAGGAVLRARFGPNDNTGNWFNPELTATISVLGVIEIFVTRTQSLELASNLSRVKLGVWRIDAGYEYPLDEWELPVINVKGVT